MSTTASIISELFRHELLRTSRDAQFLRNIVVWSLQLLLWTIIAFTLPYALEDAGLKPVDEHLPLIVLLDLIIRLASQNTPALPIQQYALLPIRKWQIIAAYLARMAIVPTNFIWLPTLWHRWWLFAIILFSGYMYLLLWHTYKRMTATEKGFSAFQSWIGQDNSLLACEMKMRMRLPALRLKIRNGLLASLMLLAVSMYVRHEAYTDFAVLYTLLFPSLPLLTSRLGYEQTYMSLLHTHMHSMRPLYMAKYLAAVLLLLPCTALLAIPVYIGLLSAYRLIAWTLGTAVLIYPVLLYVAPTCKVDSPQAQILTGATLTLPVLLTNIITL